MTASRQWHWAYTSENQLIISYNETPLRLYHQLNLNIENEIWIGDATHLCTPDTYVGQYEIQANQIIIRQIIKGPKKDYTAASQYKRIA